MSTLSQLSNDYRRVEQAICYLQENARRQPDLADVAAHVGLSEYHFQRLFSRWAGISPKRFLQFLTKENAKALLSRTSVLNAAFEAGLSGPGRLHDLLVECEAVTPGEYRSKGIGLEIFYGFHPSPFGECLLALSGRGICFLAFVEHDRLSTLEQLRRQWPNAGLHENPSRTRPVVAKVFTTQPGTSSSLLHPGDISLHLYGTNFQIKVWEALLRLSAGSVTSYTALAKHVGAPDSARAVGNAVAGNPVAYLIPCHRVLQKTGNFGNYRYGSARKQAILLWEAANGDA
jgi:AraC family transcriptional regulator, regulatory protein of adaptative response / methylated-DNA-[protein]-cysteine methyltransferase